ncbi:MAG: hypothetical protein GY749_39095 [Desulfobacteraceae bacterium]|nr:hypothetical protein [Desulfobacteraceae bacterium]
MKKSGKYFTVLTPILVTLFLALAQRPVEQVNLIIAYIEVGTWTGGTIFCLTAFILVTASTRYSGRFYDRYRIYVQFLLMTGVFVCLMNTVLLVFPIVKINIDLNTIRGIVDVGVSVCFISAGILLTLIYTKRSNGPDENDYEPKPLFQKLFGQDWKNNLL